MSTSGGVDSPATTEWFEDVPANVMPLLIAATIWVGATYGAIITGDFDSVDTALEALLDEQDRYMAASIAASSGAATELDYYGGEA